MHDEDGEYTDEEVIYIVDWFEKFRLLPMAQQAREFDRVLGEHARPIIRKLAAEDLNSLPPASRIHRYERAFDAVTDAYTHLAHIYILSDDLDEAIDATKTLCRNPWGNTSPPWSIAADNMRKERIAPLMRKLKDLAEIKNMESVL